MIFTSKTANADSLINIQFGMGEWIYDGGGKAIIGATGLTWNLVDYMEGTVMPLYYSDGSSGSATFSIDLSGDMVGIEKTGGSGILPSDPDQNLMLGYTSTDNSYTSTMSIRGLASGSYNVYIYSQSRSGIPSELIATATTSGHAYQISMSTTGDSTTLIENDNWIMRTLSITDGTLSLTIDESSISTINGLQIQAVPEPDSVVLLGIGGVFAFGLLKPRNKSRVTVES
jgi:hypothetical protein